MSYEFEQAVIAHLGVIAEELAHINEATTHTYLAVVSGLDNHQRDHLRKVLDHRPAETKEN